MHESPLRAGLHKLVILSVSEESHTAQSEFDTCAGNNR